MESTTNELAVMDATANEKPLNSSVEHTLHRPVKAHGEELKVLTIQQPTSKQAREIGRLPYVLTENATPVLDLGVVSKYICQLAAIPMSSVDALHPKDFNDIGWTVASFFLSAESEA